MAINSIPSDELKPTQNIPVVNPVVDTNIYNTSSVLADLAGQQNIAQSNVDQLNQQGKSSSSELANLQAQLGGAGQDLVDIYEKQGVNKLYNQIADINAQATGLKNEALAIPIQTQQRFANTGATDRGVAPITAGALRENALKALSLGQQAAIANAQYDKAKNYADQIITAKYAQIEANIKAKETNLKSLKDFELTPAQEKLAIAQLAKVEREKQELADKKANDKAISDMIVEAAPNAPADVIALAREAKTPVEVAQVLGQYGGDFLKATLLKEQIKTEKVQRAKINQDIAKSKAEVGALGANLGPDGKPLKALSGEASKLLSISSGLETDVNSIKAKIDKVGYEKFLRGYLLGTDRETVKLLSNAADKIGRLRSGGAINKDEEARFIAQFASRGDYAFGNADIAKGALDSILTEAQTVRGGIDPNSAYSQTVSQPQNAFSQAIGSSTSEPIGGTDIIGGVSKDGSFNFTIPTGPQLSNYKSFKPN